MAIFRLEPRTRGNGFSVEGRHGLAYPLLCQNAHWFTRIRWCVVAVLGLYALTGKLAPDSLTGAGFAVHTRWPFALAVCLSVLNGITMWHLRRLKDAPGGLRTIQGNIGFQIVSDLLILSVLVYRSGPLHTVVPFAFLFHISLACIFFARRTSFLVTLLSALLYLALAAAVIGQGREHSILANGPPIAPSVSHLTTIVAPSVLIWFVAWYLGATLSEAVRLRDASLDAANRRLRQADADKNMLVMRVAHDLKAPFAGIESNIHILRSRHAGALPKDAQRLLDNIARRGETLRKRIGDILTLGNLRSQDDNDVKIADVTLRAAAEAVLADVRELAARHNVTLALDGTDALVRTDPRLLGVLLVNLITNAIVYSHPGGRVTITVSDTPPRIRVADAGIGIAPDALPHIFDDFYRAHEAARHNPQSTGLGLAIVRQIADQLSLTIIVGSEPQQGTVFMITFPATEEKCNADNQDH